MPRIITLVCENEGEQLSDEQLRDLVQDALDVAAETSHASDWGRTALCVMVATPI
jgi:hypothetical protein